VTPSLRASRELLFALVRRDLALRYRYTLLGFGWAVALPLLSTAVFTLVFTRVAPLDVGMPYPLYVYSGMVCWNFLASALRFGSASLTANATLLTKVSIARSTLPLAAVLVALVDAAVGMIPLAALMLWYGVVPAWTVLELPAVIAVLVAFAAGLALLLAMGNLYLRDVKYLFEVLLMVWLFATAVAYPVQRIGGRLGAGLALNPMTPIIEAFRDVLLRGAPLPPSFGLVAAASALLLAGAWRVFRRAEPDFAEIA
jgi:ABC-type polysaccharide/polyol phosphate export permease